MEIYFVRHTSVAVKQITFYGHTDIDVSEKFDEEKQIVISKLPPASELVAFSSPLQRCSKLATAVMGEGNFTQDNRLKELFFGDWEMKTWDELPNQKASEWMSNFAHDQTPNGESFLEMQARLATFWQELKTKNHEKVVVFSHAGTIRTFICLILSIPLQNAFQLSMPYGAISKFTYDGKRMFLNNLNI